ncbi:MAG: aldolase [Candidatus Latescibacteria bacterium]|nr:aldolase [Candidatus Latescibacterota bacterium]
MPTAQIPDKPLVGTMIRMVNSPGIAHIVFQAGLDFFMLDMEHGAYTFNDLCAIAGTAYTLKLDCYVRVPELSRGYVSRALDCGATGVMVPMIETVEQAQKLASWAKYPPVGKRGMGSIGALTGYGRISSASSFMEEANSTTVAIAQIETVTGIKNITEIAAVDGIDALLVGPYDLSVSHGDPGNFTSPIMNKSIQKVAETARENGKIFGMHAGNSLLDFWIHHGMNMIMNDLDINILLTGMQNISERFKPKTTVV